MKKQVLKFIADKDLYKIVQKILLVIEKTNKKEKIKIYKNSIDPFSAIFDAFSQGISIKKWIEQEKRRQIQKTLQNYIGKFHQEILGSVSGWEDLGTGKIIDIKNKKRKIIAEIKNKYNTTKGNHKREIYGDFSSLLKKEYKDYTAYYVEIIPKNKRSYDKEFTPSDNRTKKKKSKNEKIRIIDGKSFYSLVTGDKEALKNLYQALPMVIGDITKNDYKVITKDPLYQELFNKIY